MISSSWMAKRLGPLLRTNLISTNKELAVKRMDALGEKWYGVKIFKQAMK